MGKVKREAADFLYRRKGSDVWNARVTINGKEHRESLRTVDWEEAKLRLVPWLKSISPYAGTIRHSWEEAAMKWWDAMNHGWKPKTARSYKKVLAVLDQHFAGMFWDQVNDKARLIQFIEDRRKAGIQTGTIKLNLMVLSGIANYTRHLPDWVPFNAVADLPKQILKPKKGRFLRPSRDCFDRIFSHMHGTFGDLCQFALLTGMRLDEIVPLERRDCRDGTITIRDQKNDNMTTVLAITPEVQAIIDRQKLHPRCPNLFVTQNGGPYKTVSNLWRSVSLRAQITAHKNGVPFQRCTFHGLRHEYAIRYLENGGSIYRLKDLLRHANVKQTEQYLVHLTIEQQARVKR